MKAYTVIVTMPEIASAHAQQKIGVDAGSWETATRRGLRKILGRPHIRGRRISHLRIDVTCHGPATKKRWNTDGTYDASENESDGS